MSELKYQASPVGVETKSKWTEVIEPHSSLFDLNLAHVWDYRDLIYMFVKRDFVATYKQTILGPAWFFIQPILTTLTFTLIFGRIAGISTDGVPMVLFYLAGLTIWNYFAECLNKTATVFKDNESVFGKVYFPRLVMPIAIVLSNLVKLGIQLILFLSLWLFFLVKNEIEPNTALLLTPYLILLMGGLGLGFGMIISSMTTKYRDLVFLLGFGVQLLLYITPVIYPVSTIEAKYRWLLMANPMASVVETFRYGFLGTGFFSWTALGYSSLFMVILLILGTVIFNKIEKSFMDTI